MVDFEDGIESDVESQVSSEPNQSDESTSDNEGGAASIEDQKDLESQTVPYSRFKEVNESNKQFAAKIAEMERKLSEMYQRPTQTQEAPKNSKHEKLLQRLQGVDPEFGEYNKELAEKLSKVDELQAQLQKYEANETRRQAQDTLNKLFTENKVGEYDQKLYRAAIREMAADGKINKIEDISTAFKELHENHTKHVDSLIRAERAKYVKDKAKDASKPTSQPKGPASKGPAEKALPMDREEAKAALVKSIMIKRRAASDL